MLHILPPSLQALFFLQSSLHPVAGFGQVECVKLLLSLIIIRVSVIFMLCTFSRALVEVLRGRFTVWSTDKCIGDIFVKFCSKLKAFTNFLNNYPIILHTIERCMEQVPVFRIFLQRHERQPMTKMMTYASLFC